MSADPAGAGRRHATGAAASRDVEELGELGKSYDLELDATIAKLKAWPTPLKLIGLQFPDGFRDYAHAFAARFERELGVPCVVSGDPSYGACDVALDLEKVGVDVLVHFAHSEMPSVSSLYKFPVLFIPARHRAPVADVVVKAAALLPGKRVGLLTTAQHGHKLGEAWDALKAAGYEPVVGKGDNRVLLPGQLLGCNFTAGSVVEDLVDGFVYVGSGDFHPIAIQWGTTKKVVLADPYTGDVKDLDAVMDRLTRQRFAAIQQAKDAKRFAILVGTHVGQARMKYALGLKKMLEDQGKEATLVALAFFSPFNLQYFRHMDCFVNTGCPRITTDDAMRGYTVPMITPPELEVVLGKRTWEDYAFDEFKGTRPAPRGEGRSVRRDEL